MKETPPTVPEGPLIDLTRQMDVAFWCRVFDVTIQELRDAVHHAGHQVPEIRRWLDHRAHTRH